MGTILMYRYNTSKRVSNFIDKNINFQFELTDIFCHGAFIHVRENILLTATIIELFKKDIKVDSLQRIGFLDHYQISNKLGF